MAQRPSNVVPIGRGSAGAAAEVYYWPLTLAIVLLAGSVAGLVVATADLTDPRILLQRGWLEVARSGWAHLAADLFLTIVLLGSAALLRGVALRRFQFCVLLSVLTHFWLAVYLYAQPMPLAVALESELGSQAGDGSEPLLLPDYHWDRIDAPADSPPAEEFDRPVPADPSGPTERAKVAPPPSDRDLPVSKPALAEPAELPRKEPEQAPLRRAEAPAPDRPETPEGAQISRQALENRLTPDLPIPQPEIKSPQSIGAAGQAPEIPPESSRATAPRRPESPRGIGRGAVPAPPAAQSPGIARSAVQPRRPEPAVARESAPAADALSLPRREGSASAPRLAAPPIEEAAVMDSPSDAFGADGPLLPMIREPSTAASRAVTYPSGISAGPSPSVAPITGPGLSRLPGSGVGQGLTPRRLEDSEAETGNERRGVAQAAPAGRGTLARSSGRPGLPESATIAGGSPRIAIGRSGGVPTIRGATGADPREFFKQRSPDRRGRVGRAFGGSQRSEEAVERGIDYLVRHQFPDGHWSLDRFPQGDAPGYEDAAGGQMNGDTAATGLALLAMLGAGYTHREGKHAAVVQRGITWLFDHQQGSGQLSTPETDQTRYTRSYGHAIAAIALCEAHGMTRDPGLREPAQRAIRFILAAQNPERGGWRYEPQRESDTSVSGWKLMALRSAQMAGVQVPAETLQRVSHWLDLAQAQGGSRYVYNPYAADTLQQREGRLPNLAMTAEGLLMRMWLGWRRDNPALIEGAQHLAANLPEVGTPSEPRRDAYYWYYATQVMFQVQGDGWKAWNERLQALLPQGQVTEGPLAGSWDPRRPSVDRWGHAGGRHYVTCLSLLTLEVYYRHLPLYQPLEK